MLYDKLAETARAQAAVVTPEEESDMEASDVEDEVPNVNSDSLPLGTTFRTIYVQDQHMLQGGQGQNLKLQEEPKLPSFIPRRLSTISSQDRESIPNIDEEQEELAETEPEMELGLQPEMPEDPLLPKPDTEVVTVNKTTEAEVHDAKLLNQTDFEWHPDTNESDEQCLAPPVAEAELVASEAAADGDDPESEALLSEKGPQKSSEIDTATALLPSTSVVQPARIGSRYKNTHV